jgi:hypothetical protein
VVDAKFLSGHELNSLSRAFLAGQHTDAASGHAIQVGVLQKRWRMPSARSDRQRVLRGRETPSQLPTEKGRNASDKRDGGTTKRSIFQSRYEPEAGVK